MAMAVTGKTRHYEWRKITLRHWRINAENCGMGGELNSIIEDLLEGVTKAVDRVFSNLPGDFPDSVASPILNGIKEAAFTLEGQM